MQIANCNWRFAMYLKRSRQIMLPEHNVLRAQYHCPLIPRLSNPAQTQEFPMATEMTYLYRFHGSLENFRGKSLR